MSSVTLLYSVSLLFTPFSSCCSLLIVFTITCSDSEIPSATCSDSKVFSVTFSGSEVSSTTISDLEVSSVTFSDSEVSSTTGETISSVSVSVISVVEITSVVSEGDDSYSSWDGFSWLGEICDESGTLLVCENSYKSSRATTFFKSVRALYCG